MPRLPTLSLAVCTALVLGSCSSSDSCEADEPGHIKLENSSADVHVIVIDGEEHGRIYPSDTEVFDVEPGEHTVETKLEDGGDACTPLTVLVDACETESWCCPECSSGGSGDSGGGGCSDAYPLDCGTFCCPIGYPFCCPGGTCSANGYC